ncbi:LAMI_0H01750g1_1 [Lachancea mirantina]|uniref:LAMI_0H01750g1_1 n=1 Tax=Lachancea mirantina TaxID=1230905 RepID=A0A1G4KDZ3_9SACH|nr:LAMI_0H01750g1_1 [Lachancea mirantina]
MDRNDQRWREKELSLPKLPPLSPGNRMLPNNSRKSNVPIGWTPVMNSPLSPSDSEHNSPSSGSRFRSGRPPPPPLLSQIPYQQDTERRIKPDDHSKTASSTPLNRASRPSSSYASPFIGEDELRMHDYSAASTPTKIYKSPFMGDATGVYVKRTQSSTSTPKSRDFHDMEGSELFDSSLEGRNESLPSITFEARSPGENQPTLKALPSLPPRDKVALPGKQLPILPKLRTLNDSKDPLALESSFYKPPPRLHSDLRGSSDSRTVSGSISSYYSNTNYTFNEEDGRQSSFGSIVGGKPLQEAPSVIFPTQPFSIELLDENRLYQCYNVFFLSDVYEWLLKVYFEWFNEYVFHKIEFFQLVQLLLEFQLPHSCDQDLLDSNVDKIIESLVFQGAVRFQRDTVNHSDDEITFIVAGLNVQGVFPDLLPCYSPNGIQIHGDQDMLCYCPRCPKRISNLSRPDLKLSEVINKTVGHWTDYWQLKPDELAEINPREVKRQSLIFDLIVLEERSLNLANAAIEIYGRSFSPKLLPYDPEFFTLAFDTFTPLIDLHKEFLLGPILWKLKSKGKFIDGVGKIYLKWCNEAHDIYSRYAVSMAEVHEIITWEKEHDTNFAHWLKQLDESSEISRSKLYHDVVFFGGFFKSLQNIPLTLNSILKWTDPSSEDYEYLKMAITEIEKLSANVDRIHGEAADRRKITRLARQLLLYPGSSNSMVNYINVGDPKGLSETGNEKLDLRLNERSRRILKSGVLTRRRDLWLEGSPSFVVLLDNYLLITELSLKEGGEKYKLSERPVPIDYLSLESKEDVNWQHLDLNTGFENKYTSQPYSASLERPLPPSFPSRPVISKVKSSVPFIPKTLQGAVGMNSTEDFTEGSEGFKFKIRNTATNESFTFLCSSSDDRKAWIIAIIRAFKINQEKKDRKAFTMRCLTDAFAYDEREAPINLPVTPEGSEIDVALKCFYKTYGKLHSPLGINAQCSARFFYENQEFILCGLNGGVFMACADDLSSWKQILSLSKVSLLQVNLKLALLFTLADRRLCYFTLPSLICAYYDPNFYLTDGQLTGVLLREKVTFFKVADDFGNSRQLFYERKGKLVILTPEFDRITKAFKFFKFYKEFDLPSGAGGLTYITITDIVVFKKSFIACSSKGGILYNEAFNDSGIQLPSFAKDKGFKPQHHFSHHPFKTAVEKSAKKNSSRLKMAEYVKFDIAANMTLPVTCFKLAEDDFVLIYDEAVIKLNKHGEIPNWQTDIMVLDFFCTGAALQNDFLFLVGENLVQIYDLSVAIGADGKMNKLAPVQIIKSKKIKLISNQRDESTTVVLSHPLIPGRQCIFEFRPS